MKKTVLLCRRLYFVFMTVGVTVGFTGMTVGCAGRLLSDDKTRVSGPVRAATSLVLLTDFGLKDGAVSAMKGVAAQVAPQVAVSDLSHEVPPYDIWEGAYRLSQTYSFWPKGTVFVAVVDPGVGSERKSIVLESRSGHVFVGPDNGLFTLVADAAGIARVTVIDEATQRIAGSEESYTFHGRDVFASVGARIAAGSLEPSSAGAPLGRDIERISYPKAEKRGESIFGGIPVLDPNYGNVWTGIPKALMKASGLSPAYRVVIRVAPSKSSAPGAQARDVFRGVLPLRETFAAVPKGQPLLYFNSLMNLALALNQGDFAKTHRIGSGPLWSIEITPERKGFVIREKFD